VAVLTCGICLGFLPHNFYPAKIFMGDAGAHLLG
jgi:UDP-GlcNAc:undecaprenyl-phosphate GlcNAc-1-phosphate transferase